MTRLKRVWSDVKLDNKKELSQKYLHGGQNNTESIECDEDFLLECYRQAGGKIVYDLIGTFSFSVWDESRELYWCARDQIGLATFYYMFLEGAFISSSSLTELLDLLPHKPKPCITSMKEFAWHSARVNPEHTMYEGVYRLPPGHQMIVRNGETEVSRYWDPKSIKVDDSITLDEAAETFLALFSEAVSCRLAKDETTGCELSGGLDSSSIFCVGKEQGAEMQAYSMRFGSMRCDESSYIDEVLEYTGEQGIGVATDNLDYQDRYNLNFNYTLAPHWPLWNTSFFKFPMLEKMQKDGIKSALSGQGGDQVLIGSPFLCFDYMKEMRLRAFWREYKALGPNTRKQITNGFVKSLLRQVLPPSLISKLKHLLPSRYIVHETPPLQSYREYTDTYFYANSFSQKTNIGQITSASHFLFMDTNIYRVAAEHYGVDYHHPFFDLRVVEFLLSVPSKFKYSDGKIRQLHRSAMKGIMPEGVRTRLRKTTFGEMVIQHLETLDLDNFRKEAHIVRLGVVTQKTLDAIHLDYKSNNLGYEHQAMRYWQLINLEQWYRFNYDSDRA